MNIPSEVQGVICNALLDHIEKLQRSYEINDNPLKSRHDIRVKYLKQTVDWYLTNCDDYLQVRLLKEFEKLQDLVKKC